MVRKQIPSEALIDLRRRLDTLPIRSSQRKIIMNETAQLYDISIETLYRTLREHRVPKALRRTDWGFPRVLAKETLEHYCEIIAAIKIRTSNKKGRHLSTSEAIRLLEEFGIYTPDEFVKAPRSLLKKSTINRYLKQWGYDYLSLTKQPPAVRFQAQYSNQLWHFDLSPSDLKHIKKPAWYQEEKGHPILMLYSVVDDRSGVAYQEYRCVYGEDTGAALRFLFNAMRPKEDDKFPFQGIPEFLYMDRGPIARSHVFQQVMQFLGTTIQTHLPQGKKRRRQQTARAKGKVERPFRTVKEMHETLYHFHKPETEEEANVWLLNFLLRYNNMEHRSEPHSRFDDWIENISPAGTREMCTWERYCTFAREPERRTVGGDARISTDGILYEVDPELAGEVVILWWGVFDNELYVEHGEKRYGPYSPIGAPVPIHRYRSFKKTRTQKRADRIESLAENLHLPRDALTAEAAFPRYPEELAVVSQAFLDPDPFQELTFPNAITAKKAISDHLGIPLARLHKEQLEQINAILGETLDKKKVIGRVRDFMEKED